MDLRPVRNPFALLLCLAATLSAAGTVRAQAPVLTSIRVDGNFADWQAVLLSPSQVTLDGDGSTLPCEISTDRDCIVGSGRDLRLFAWTWDSTYLYLHAKRQNSATNEMAVWWYLDRNLDGRMGSSDRVLRVRYHGGNRTTTNELYAYQPVSAGGDPLVDAQGFADGYTLPGDLPGAPLWSETVPDGGGPMGLQFEERIPWSALGLPPGSAVNFHVAGSNSANPQNVSQQVDDNLGGPDGGLGTTGYRAITVTPDRSGSAAAGGSVSYAHVVRNVGNLPSVVALNTTSTLGLSVELFDDPDGNGVGNTLLAADANGDGDYADPGDFLAPLADSDADGLPDTRSLAPGAQYRLVLRLTTRQGQNGLTDTTVLTGFATAAPATARASATDTTAIGAISLASDDPAKTGVAGQSVSYSVQACNQGTPDTIELNLRSSLGLDLVLWSDPDCDGRPDAVLARDRGGDGTWDAVAGGDSNGDGNPDTGLLRQGECACFVVTVELPAGLPPGTLERTTVEGRGATAPTRASLRLDTTTAPWLELFPDRTFAAGLDLAVGAGRSAWFPHRLRKNASLDETVDFFLTGPDNDRGWTVRVWTDPNGDGNPADGRPVQRIGPVAANGGEADLVVEVQVPPDQPPGTTSTSLVTASSILSAGVSASVTDELAVSRIAAYRDALFSLPATSFAACQEIFVEGSGLRRRLAPGEDPYDLAWFDGLDELVRFRDDFVPDGLGLAHDSLLPDGSQEPGAWRVELREEGLSIQDLGLEIEASGEFLSLAAAQPLYPLVGSDLSINTSLRNLGTGASQSGTHLEHVILDPSGTLWLRSGLPSGYEPYSGAELTRRRNVPTLPAGGVLNDMFTVPEVTHPVEGVYTIVATWTSSCGIVLARGTAQFVVGAGELDCSNGSDDDGDGLVDCEDPECAGDPACVETLCADGLDDDGDGLVDCEDPDCALDPVCLPETDCTNGIDDDSDGFVDCADPDCALDPACPETDCTNGLDDDGDGQADCLDLDCADDPACTETDCGNGLDDDGDGAADCADLDCAKDPACFENDCTNGVDDDGDGGADCADSDCAGDPACEPESPCDDGLDNDSDGLVDCDDPDCAGSPTCPETNCTNGVDDDGDGFVDCADSDCAGDPACFESDCTNGVDDDGDGLTDCADPDCALSGDCREDDCANGVDDDGDGDVDCADSDCSSSPDCRETRCADGLDDDGDGLVDCEDPDCAGDPACGEDDCTNGIDDDSDGETDCADPDCADDPACTEDDCSNGVDDDGDGLVDCADPDCLADPGCRETDCANGVDDDGDGATDCEDPDCAENPACREDDCTNGLDDDGDGLTDCVDPDCSPGPDCPETDCANGIDDDGDGDVDCADSDCAGDPACTESDCSNGLDDDGDGAIDCLDPDCMGDPACPEDDCANGIDDDGDGDVDCDDSDCAGRPECLDEAPCDDGIDGDGDGLVDCDDPDCAMDPACFESDCANGVDDDGDGLVDCEDPDCADDPACFESNCVNMLDDDGDGFVDCDDPDCADDPACVEDDCTNGADDDGDGLVDCEDSDCASDPACVEDDCANGVDDDGDGLVDCEDPDCAGDPACVENDCANGVDDDGDGLVDCEDPDCADDPACMESDCANGVDDDGDGLVDCEDPDCLGDPACDCDPSDPGAFAVPPRVSLLLVTREAQQPVPEAVLRWTDVRPLAGTSTVYDVSTGILSELWSDRGVLRSRCLADDQGPNLHVDSRGLGRESDGYWYDVRAVNACGVGLYGTNSFGADRTPTACP